MYIVEMEMLRLYEKLNGQYSTVYLILGKKGSEKSICSTGACTNSGKTEFANIYVL